MGSLNNIKIRKPHGAKALADQHKRCAPSGLAGLLFSVSSKKLTSKKSKQRKRAKVGAVH